MIATILMDDDPLLRKVSEPVADFDGGLQHLVDRMIDTLRGKGGRGLAAIQIGVPQRVLVIREGMIFRPFINPTLVRTLNRHAVEHEGCLSIPKWKWGAVSRPAKCDVAWLTPDAQEISATLTGETARIFQHEFDHLNGVLMTDRMKIGLVSQPDGHRIAGFMP